MGCKPSELQIQHNGDLFNEDINIKGKFITGLHLARKRENNDRLEENFQLAFAKSKLKKYEKLQPFQHQKKKFYIRISIKFFV